LKIFISRRFPVQAIIWKASINVLIVQIGSWKQEVAPKKEQNGIRPHTPKVKRVREISWILPTKTIFIVKRRWDQNAAEKWFTNVRNRWQTL